MPHVSKRIDPNVPGLDPDRALPHDLPTAVRTASFTLLSADYGRHQRVNSGSPVTVTVPNNDTVPFLLNTNFSIEQAGAGAVSFAAAAGVTINKATGKQAQIAGQFGVAQLVKTGTNEWTLFGALA